MNLTNYHSHCSFCDGRAPMEDFVRAAIDAGFSAYGVSSHAPLPFATKWTLDSAQVPAYLQELDRLKKKYAGQIELYAAMEIDYLNDQQNPAIPWFQEMPLDYRIGSLHLIYTDEGEIVDTDTGADNFKLLLERHFHGDLKNMVTGYYKASMRMVEWGGFDFIGHADKISFNAECCEPGVTGRDWYVKLRTELFEAIAGKGILMEINTKALLKRGCFFPDQKHFNFIRQLGIPVVVNSDAHFPENINAGRPQALEALKQAGFQSVREFHQGAWQDIDINTQAFSL